MSLLGDKVCTVVVSLHVNGRSYALAQASILNSGCYLEAKDAELLQKRAIERVERVEE